MLGIIFHWLVGWGGIGLIVMVAAIVVAVIEPAILTPFLPRRYAIEIAIVAAFLTFSSAKFYHDGATYVQSQWDAARAAALKGGNDARTGAERGVDDGVRDPRDTDRQ